MTHALTPAAGQVGLINALDAWLPQTQCTRCGYPRCCDYAEALARGSADVNRCPPGGEASIAALARLLDRPVLALDTACGVHEPRVRALIDETVCIGCRKCLDVCPVDAIVGARKLMHTVIEGECNGCGLCVPPCPVDCIALVPANVTADPDSPWPEYSRTDAGRWRARTGARLARLARRKSARTARAKKGTPPPSVTHPEKRPDADATAIFPDRATIRAEIGAAIERARAKRRRDNPA